MKKILIVVDMQKDFVDGALGTAEAVAIVPKVKKKIEEFDGEVIYTLDTHPGNYMATQEGRNLPVEHCIEGTPGHQLVPELAAFEKNAFAVFKKPTFGSIKLGEFLLELDKEVGLESVELVGLCTDICVVSNALLIKAFLPEVPIMVDPACCAGVTPESHEQALATMKMCQIQVL